MSHEESLDARLVAFLDGECPPAERRALQARLRAEPAVRARLQMLRAADRALREGLGAGRAPRRGFGHALLALAAAAVVVVVVVLLRDRGDATDDPATAGNDLVTLHVAPRGGGSQPLFTDLSLEVRIAARRPHTALVVHRARDVATHAQWAADFAAHGGADELPLLLEVGVSKPDGTRLPARFAVGDAFRVAGSQLEVVPLRGLEVDDPAVARPYLGGVMPAAGSDGGWIERFDDVVAAGRLVPTEPGEWRLSVSLRPLPVPGRTWADFPQPVVAETSVVLQARTSAWSEPVDGMVARLVIADRAGAIGRTPIALQLRNVAGRMRRYNVTGTTAAPIPQPFHFQLLVDGAEWQQRDDLAVISASHTLSLEHADGAVRTLVVMPDYWRGDGKRLGDLPGRHELQLLFHHQALLKVGGDAELWEGKLLTPSLPLAVPTSR